EGGPAPGRTRSARIRRAGPIGGRRSFRRAPGPVVVLLPGAVLTAVHVSVTAGIHIAAAGPGDSRIPLGTAPRPGLSSATTLSSARGRAGGPVGHAGRLRPLVAALHRCRPPATVHTRPLPSARVGARPRVVSLSNAARTVGSPRGSTTCVCAG